MEPVRLYFCSLSLSSI